MAGRSSSLALARSCTPAASLLVNVGEPGDAEKVGAWARACETCCEGAFFIFIFLPSRGACRILVPQSRMNGCPAAVEARSPNPWIAGEFWEGTLRV